MRSLSGIPVREHGIVSTHSLHVSAAGHFAPGRPSAPSRASFPCTSVSFPTCFVEGISVGVAGRLLGRFCGVHAGIRFNTIQRQKTQMFKKKKKSSAPENPLVSPHMFSVPLLIPPSASMCCFLSEDLRVAAGFASLYCSRSNLPLCCCPLGSLYLPPSPSPSPPHPPLLSRSSLSLFFSGR